MQNTAPRRTEMKRSGIEVAWLNKGADRKNKPGKTSKPRLQSLSPCTQVYTKLAIETLKRRTVWLQ